MTFPRSSRIYNHITYFEVKSYLYIRHLHILRFSSIYNHMTYLRFSRIYHDTTYLTFSRIYHDMTYLRFSRIYHDMAYLRLSRIYTWNGIFWVLVVFMITYHILRFSHIHNHMSYFDVFIHPSTVQVSVSFISLSNHCYIVMKSVFRHQ